VGLRTGVASAVTNSTRRHWGWARTGSVLAGLWLLWACCGDPDSQERRQPLKHDQ